MANKEFSRSFLSKWGAESTAGAKHQKMRMVPLRAWADSRLKFVPTSSGVRVGIRMGFRGSGCAGVWFVDDWVSFFCSYLFASASLPWVPA